MKNRKYKALGFGAWAERLACLLLRAKGYVIVERNYRHPSGEIDIIARRSKTLCFVEVKARRTLPEALEALQPYQQNRISRSANTFLLINRRYAEHTIRFDLVAVAPWRWPVHVKNIWFGS